MTRAYRKAAKVHNVAITAPIRNNMSIFNNPMDFYQYSTKLFNAIPKSTEELADTIERVRDVMEIESKNCMYMAKVYADAANGDATANEISRANEKATDFVKTAAFATALMIPGAFFAMPLIIEKAREHNVDLVSKSIAEHFDI